jgi:hypothetical protein
METLTAFVSKDSDETNTYKSGDRVKFNGVNKGIGEVVYKNGWSIYDIYEKTKIMDINDEIVKSKQITMTPLYNESNSIPLTVTEQYAAQYSGLGSHMRENYGGRSRKSRKSKSRKSRKSRK